VIALKDGTEACLVDIPGYDDTYMSDAEMLKGIASSLNQSYPGGIPLSGMIYIHRMLDRRELNALRVDDGEFTPHGFGRIVPTVCFLQRSDLIRMMKECRCRATTMILRFLNSSWRKHDNRWQHPLFIFARFQYHHCAFSLFYTCELRCGKCCCMSGHDHEGICKLERSA